MNVEQIQINPHLHVDNQDMLKKNVGFTLVEIIVVISIMLVLLGTGTVSYNYVNQQKSLEQDAEMIRDRLSIIHERTVGRQIPSTITCDPFNGYRLRIDQPSGNFLLYIRCGPPPPPLPQSITETNIAADTFTLNSSRIAFPTVDTDYTFLYPYACDTASCNTNRIRSRITIRNQNNTQCMDVNIDKVGSTSFTKPYNGPC